MVWIIRAIQNNTVAIPRHHISSSMVTALEY